MKNPLVKGNKITLKNKKENLGLEGSNIQSNLIGMNNAIPICAEACSCCWDSKLPEGFDNIAEYVAKRSRIGHTSVLEHSNIVMLIDMNAIYADDLVDFLDSVKYLNTRIVRSRALNRIYMLIGGSFRGFADIYREISDLNNIILNHISKILYTYSHSSAFEDICNLGLMDKNRFLNIEPDENFKLLTSDNFVDNELFKIIGLDDIGKLYNNIYDINEEVANLITTYDLIKFTTITILFKNMSRTSTHQLVRHRNAITQESQRYVDYSKACFNSPEIFKPDKYDKDHKYRINFGPCSPVNMTLSEIGEAMCNIYNMLHNPVIAGKEFSLLKEDARAFLPSNVQCKKIYITFTIKNFLKFLNLREDKHAQAEIRKYATALGEWFRSITQFSTKELCDLYTEPRSLIEDPLKITIEDKKIVNETIELSEEDYIKAAGLNTDD